MKRLAAVLAAAVLGTGCIFVDEDPRTCDRTATIQWTFERADGGQTGDCTTAGVTAIDVFVNGYPAGPRFGCGAGAGTVPIAAGVNEVVVEGVDGGGTIRYRDYLSVEAPTCGHQGTVASMPGQGYVDVDYAFSPVNACYPTQPTYMWLAVRDDVAGQIAFVESDMTSLQACSTIAAAPRYAVPVGSFTLLGIEEVLPVSGGATTVRADCTDRPFEVDYLAVTTVQPVLVASNAQCF